MSISLMPSPRQRFFTNSGQPAAQYLVYTFDAGTVKPAEVYQDADAQVPHENPIRLDMKGEAVIYFAAKNYKIDVRDPVTGASLSGYPVENFQPPLMADVILAPAGAGMVGFLHDATYSAGTLGRWLQDLAKSAGSSMLGFIQAGTGAVLRTVQDELRDRVSVKQFGAVGGGANDTAALSAIETSASSGAYLPAGLYATSLATLAKNYNGPGAVKLSSGRVVPGEFAASLMPRYLDPMHRAGAAKYQNSPRNVVFVGDSISYGFGVDEASSYSCRLAATLNEQGPGVNVSKAGGASALLRAVPSGSVSTGTAGPLKQSRILAPGASLTITVDNPDFCGFWYQKAPGAGTIVVTVNGSNTLTQNCAGVAESDAFAMGAFYRVAGAATITLTCSVAPVEITGAYFSRWLRDGQVSVMAQAMSGYSTADFATQAQIDAIGKQTTYKGTAFPVYVVALGTNDIYSATRAVSSATYKANLEMICQGLRAYGIPVITVPLRAVESSYSPVIEPFDNYRAAAYEVARKYGYYVIDLSQHDLGSTGGYQSDGLHPNDLGHSLLASIYWEELGLSGVNYAMPAGTLALSAPYAAFGAPYSTPSYAAAGRGQISLSGFIAVNGAAKNTPIVNLPAELRPPSSKLFVVGGLNGATGTTATVQVNPDGNVMMYDYPLAGLTQLTLEGITYSTLR